MKADGLFVGAAALSAGGGASGVALLLAGFAAWGVPQAAAGQADLTPLLSGFEIHCEPPKAFSTFEKLARRKFGLIFEGAPDPGALPAEWQAAAKRSVIVIKRPYDMLVRAPVTGTFRGVDVAAVEFWWGIDNGIQGADIVLKTPPGQVNQDLRRDVVAGAKTLDAERKEAEKAEDLKLVPYLSYHVVKGVARIRCDWST